MLCILKACRKCSGDLVLDGDELRCWQCGWYYYPKPSPGNLPRERATADRPLAGVAGVAAGRRRSGRAGRDINSAIAAKDRSEDRWWIRNRETIRFLDKGRSIREISLLVGRGERQIRVVRERLNDLRAATEPAGGRR